MTNRIPKVCALAVLWGVSLPSSAMADWSCLDGHGPDTWMVVDVAPDDVLRTASGVLTYSAIGAHLGGDAYSDGMTIDRAGEIINGVWTDSGEAGLGTETRTATSISGSGGEVPPKSDDALASLSRQFLSANGYEPQDSSALAAAIEEQLTPLNPESVFRPVADIGPFVKAVLALEAADGVVERSRYRIRYGLKSIPMPPGGPAPVSFVQVDRFDLGPAIREEAVAVLGEGNVAPAAAFGEGAHVSWRLVMHPMMGNAAVIDAAARLEISDDDAATMLCLGTPCLSTATAIADAAPWSEMEETDRHPEASYRTERDGLPTPAAVIEMLTADAVLEMREAVGPTEPFAEAVIELHLGQDAALDAALRDGEMMDDSIRAIWRRISAISSGLGVLPKVFTARAFECRRGPDFAEPGDFCL